MIPVRMLIIVFGGLLGPAVLWWGLTIIDHISEHGRANAATIMQGFGGCVLIMAGFAAACVAAALVLKPIAEYLDREFSL